MYSLTRASLALWLSLCLAVLPEKSAQAEPAAGPRTTIAIADFGLTDAVRAVVGDTERGTVVAMLSTELEKTDRFVVVEREGLTELLSEQELTASGLLRPEGAPNPGALIGARLIVMGDITEFARTTSSSSGSVGVANLADRGIGLGLAPKASKGVVGIDVRIVDSESGQIVSSFSVRKAVKRTSLGLRLDFGGTSIEQQSFSDSPVGKALREAVTEVTRQVVAETNGLAWQGRVVDFDAGEVAINAGRRDGVAVGERYQIHRVSKVLRDPATGRVLGSRKRHIGELTVEFVDEQLAFGRFTPAADGNPQPNDLVTL
ncbi:MAG: CsgG/HfaB family protein [Pseudomonadota bacterium]